MKRLLCIVAGVMATLSVWAAPAPKITCEEPVYNFGETEARNVSHDFVIRNEGDLTLEINKVRPTCGCTVAKLDKKKIPPGEEAVISSTLSLRGRRGRVVKTIRVMSNDPEQPMYKLSFDGRVKKTAAADSAPRSKVRQVKQSKRQAVVAPPQLVIPNAANQDVTRYLLIRFGSEGPFNVREVEVPDPAITATVKPVGGRGYRIQLLIPNPPQWDGQSIKIHTDSETQAVFEVPIKS